MSRFFASFLLLAYCAVAADLSNHDKLNALIQQEWQYQLQDEPEFATFVGDNRYNDKLRDISAEAYARRAAHQKAVLTAFEKLPTDGLTEADKLDLALIIDRLKVEVAGVKFKDWEMPVNQMNGAHLGYAGMSKDVPLNTVADYENYIKRLRALPKMFEQLTADMRLGMKDGLMPPRYLLDNVATEADEIAKTPLDKNLFADPLKHFPAAFSIQDQKRLTDELAPTVSAIVLPAYAKFARFVKQEYAPKGRTEFGIWALPDGEARYRQNIVEQTTTQMSPEELHELGLKQVAEIDAQMLAIAKAQAFNDLKSFNKHIHDEQSFYGVSGDQVLGLYQKYADQMKAKLPMYFGSLPQNKLVVVPMEDFRAQHGVPADYGIGAGDGSRPGRINVNEYDPTHRLLLNVEAIAYHEGIPGHHLQFSIAQELKDVPAFRRFSEYNSFSEGWALYSETLAHEMGFYQDPYSEYGRLQNLMWRSIRLVVDTGVHSRHWTRQQMIDFFHAHTAMDDQNIATEVDRYIAWPGQALGYKLGEMVILKERAKAQAMLKDQFDIRAFHDAVLGAGPLPLSVLEERMNNWITAQLSNHDKLGALIEQEWQYQLQDQPEMATQLGDSRYNDRLRDISAEAFARRLEHRKAALAEFQKIPQDGLTEADKMNLALMTDRLKVEVAGAKFKDWEMPVNQVNGPHLNYASLANRMPFKTVADYENYIKRLRALPQMFEQLTADMKLGMKDGLMPPRYLLEDAAKEADQIAKTPLDQSLFADPLKHFPASFSTQDQKRLADELGPTVTAIVQPAYAKFARFVKEDYAPKGRTEFGIWALPEGGERYRQNIHEQTTTDMSPDELHALGLKQVEEIDAQMLTIAKAQGFSDLKSFNQHIHDDRALYGVTGEQVLGLYQKYADQMYAKLPLYFNRLPKNKLVVTPMESFRAPNGYPADYSPGAGDGSRPGHINVNEYDPTKRLLLNTEAIAYHEGIPGHHLQITLAQEMKDVPAFRRMSRYSSFSEGWALYSETLSHEMGFYQDPYSEYGRLENLMWRSIRLVVDTGVHSKHWTRQQMIDFFHAHTAMDDQNITTEVDRYIAWPGQALGYKLGEMVILKERAKAQTALKEKFDIRAFHDQLLGAGALPLSVLEQRMDDWIAGQMKN